MEINKDTIERKLQNEFEPTYLVRKKRLNTIDVTGVSGEMKFLVSFENLNRFSF